MKMKVRPCLYLLIILSLFTGCTKEKLNVPTQNGIASSAQQTVETESGRYQLAIDDIQQKKYPQAVGILKDLGDYKSSKDLLEQLRYLVNGSYISNGIWAVGAITSNGKVQIACSGENRFSGTESWNNIISISLRGGESAEGLAREGILKTTSTVTAEEFMNSPVVSNNVLADVVKEFSSWNKLNIKAFQSVYPFSAIALTKDGYVYAAYPGYEDGVGRLDDWKDIVAVADGRSYAIGLKSDGTVVSKDYGYAGTIEVSGWTDIVAISAGHSIIGLKADGTVVSTGLNAYGEGNVSEWTDIIAISTCGGCTLGLKSDGTVVAAGQNSYGEMDVSGWRDIVAIAAGEYFSLGLRADGTMVLAGDCSHSGAKTPGVSSMKGLYVPKISLDK